MVGPPTRTSTCFHLPIFYHTNSDATNMWRADEPPPLRYDTIKRSLSGAQIWRQHTAAKLVASLVGRLLAGVRLVQCIASLNVRVKNAGKLYALCHRVSAVILQQEVFLMCSCPFIQYFVMTVRNQQRAGFTHWPIQLARYRWLAARHLSSSLIDKHKTV